MVITIPSFVGARPGVQHFFGTIHEATKPVLYAQVVV